MTFSLAVCRGRVAQSGCLRAVNYGVRDSRYAAACAVAVTFSLTVCRGRFAQSGCLRAVNYGVRDSSAAAHDVAVDFVYIIGLRGKSFCFNNVNAVF